MFRISLLLLMPFVLGALADSPILDFQEQFAELSRDIEPQLRDYRAENVDVRAKAIHRSLDALGNLTTEMRNISWDYWAQIESHELANPECLEIIRKDFDYYVLYGGQDIKGMADDLHWYLRSDTFYRFYPVVSRAQRENSRTIYQTVQTLGRNQFLNNMADTVYELQDELEYYRTLWEANQERLQLELADVEYLMDNLEYEIEWWHEFTVRWHHVFMNFVLDSVYYLCVPEENAKHARSPPSDDMLLKLEESKKSKIVKDKQFIRE